jgi:hypothetical protein
MILYDTLDPGNKAKCVNRLLRSEPVFIPGERTAYTWGEILGANNLNIHYLYRIDGGEKKHYGQLNFQDSDIVC